MAMPDRRRFLLGVAALLPLPFVARRFHGLAVQSFDPAILRALADAVLPAELGPAGTERAVAEFERWLAGYREGAEILHGYGTGEIRRTGPSPALKWSAQVRDLGGASFLTRTRVERQDIIRGALTGLTLNSLPPADRAPHIAVGLLAHFYDSPVATDLCYNARIGRNSCRPLAESPRRPLPLAPRS